MRVSVLSALVLYMISLNGYAEDAFECVEVGKGERSQSIFNICDVEVEVLWCHNQKAPGYGRGLCGYQERYYQKQAVLQPGEQKQNYFSLPFNSTLYIAACKGGHYSTRQVGMEGGYLCD
ncbi:MAG: hypothetical protein KBT54_11300 [Amphritea sp.]|nr:hypothetical protein [Amphritea sp.]